VSRDRRIRIGQTQIAKTVIGKTTIGKTIIGKTMENVISEYQRWKQQGESLRVNARQAMEERFRDLLTEAVRIAHEYQTDFGSTLKPPAPVTAFRYKPAPAKKKSVKTAGPKPTKVPSEAKAPSEAKSPKSSQVVALEKRLAQARAKLDAAKTAGKPTRTLEDRIYEIEDDLRLSSQPA
jgi:hypothetical protein